MLFLINLFSEGNFRISLNASRFFQNLVVQGKEYYFITFYAANQSANALPSKATWHYSLFINGA